MWLTILTNAASTLWDAMRDVSLYSRPASCSHCFDSMRNNGNCGSSESQLKAVMKKLKKIPCCSKGKLEVWRHSFWQLLENISNNPLPPPTPKNCVVNVCKHKFACTNVTPKQRNRAHFITHAPHCAWVKKWSCQGTIWEKLNKHLSLTNAPHFLLNLKQESAVLLQGFMVLTSSGCSWKLDVLLCLVGIPGLIRVVISLDGRLFAILGEFLRHKLLIHT